MLIPVSAPIVNSIGTARPFTSERAMLREAEEDSDWPPRLLDGTLCTSPGVPFS